MRLENLTTGQTIPAPAMQVSWDANQRSARWTFSGYPAGLPDGNYRATVPAAAVSDMAGNSLGSDLVFEFYVMSGDANRDRAVDFNDLAILAQNYNTVGGMTFDRGDFNYDGNADFNDLAMLAQRYNTSLSPPALGAVPVATAVFNAAVPIALKRPIKKR
jgi:hypothetical protein